MKNAKIILNNEVYSIQIESLPSCEIETVERFDKIKVTAGFRFIGIDKYKWHPLKYEGHLDNVIFTSCFMFCENNVFKLSNGQIDNNKKKINFEIASTF